MQKTYKTCQSCGMPLKRDPHGGGTEADGSHSPRYCSHCYQDGRFVLPDIKVDEMQARARAKMADMGVPNFIGGFFTRGIPKLGRWQV